jgi:hypothetical protein
VKPRARAQQRYGKSVRKRWMSPYFEPAEREMMRFEVRRVIADQQRCRRESIQRLYEQARAFGSFEAVQASTEALARSTVDEGDSGPHCNDPTCLCAKSERITTLQ